MHPRDCPLWEYSDHPRRSTVFRTEVSKCLAELRRGTLKTEDAAEDSRALHGRIFAALTPPGYGYYAGHFRGENYRCLKFNSVMVKNDSRVGFQPQTVAAAMNALIYRVRLALAKIDALTGDPLAQFTHAVRFASYLFELVLRIHPYVNGNGHIARFAVWAVLGRYERWPDSWPVEPRSPDLGYITMIVEYRNGNHAPLEEFLIRTVLG
jgi:fido (protein-threonine AMPylation protein)